ncbi:hypothetical protein NQ318_006993 [Aromia moschata]|uniref:DUF4817 domain-containing protein n=1 Tax=Aromia moschata TaxID=1265417 RepID=A0AAV8X1N9_9CUCU|nr:hypothetical protein NQ318_006993 [Aromia moschata]
MKPILMLKQNGIFLPSLMDKARKLIYELFHLSSQHVFLVYHTVVDIRARINIIWEELLPSDLVTLVRKRSRDWGVFVLQFREMVYLTEMHKITILQMIGYGDRTRTQAEVVRLFQEKYPELPPIYRTVSKIEKQFLERGRVRQLKKNPPNKLSDDQKLDVMLMLEENPHTSSR